MRTKKNTNYNFPIYAEYWIYVCLLNTKMHHDVFHGSNEKCQSQWESINNISVSLNWARYAVHLELFECKCGILFNVLNEMSYNRPNGT